jgi:heme-degrading monooxygenase HmoA
VIARIWRGVTPAAKADAHLDYLDATGLSAYRSTQGNRGVEVLRRIDGDRAEFLLLSLWETMDDVRRFAGPDPDRAVSYPEDDEYLIEKDPGVRRYEVVRLYQEPPGPR